MLRGLGNKGLVRSCRFEELVRACRLRAVLAVFFKFRGSDLSVVASFRGSEISGSRGLEVRVF